MAPAHSSTAERARRRRAGAAALLLSALVGAGTAAGTPAAAEDYQLCNRTAYILEAALAIETQGSSATQGWFRTLPGSCTVVLENPGEGERYFLHVRTPAFYGEKGETAKLSAIARTGSRLTGDTSQRRRTRRSGINSSAAKATSLTPG